MSKLSKIILAIGLLSILATAVSALEIDEPQYNPNVIHPGDDVDVWIDVANDEGSDETIEDLRITVTSKYPFEVKQVNPTKGVYTISSLSEGGSDTAYFKLHINEDASSRDYRLDVKVSYDIVEYKNGDRVVTSRSFTKVYYIPVYGLANFEINSDGVTLTPAKTESVQLKVMNKGTGTAKDATLTIGSNDLINPVDSTKFYLGSLSPDVTKLLSINLHASGDTTEGSYLIPATLSWIDEDGTENSEIINIGFIVEGDINLGISNVITDPTEIKAQETYVKIDVDITNNGHGETKNVEIDLLSEDPFTDSWSNSNFKNIGILNSGDTKTAVFYIDVDKDAKSGHYAVPLNITYMDVFDEEYSEIEYIDLYIKPKPVLEILPETYTLKAGDENTITLTLQNTGSEKAQSVKISAIKNSAQPFEFTQKTDSIGTLDLNETGEGQLIIDVDSDAANKEYLITVEVRSVGDSEKGDDNVYLSQKTVRVNVEGGGNSTVVYLAVLLLVGGLGYYMYLKRKKEKEQTE
ncbi:conserved hypothetical protein [Methanococcus maripaludis C5]|uniref:Uncharacterized protein n=1 Tax=Methanococcus maripaludis (strain C5 / ATCC BAA-1333) TaxID=402880 RepID=A4FXF8_METM5|nr:COG1361 S-layer family protein [Methanococcus maripaludis]ABO34887.1 conserved hypothetical protein [Methanococcus maripaludis C5]